MQGRWLLNIVLLVAVLLLGWLALGDPDEQQQNTTPLSAIDPLSIKHLRIEHENQPVILLEKKGSQWHMQSPYKTLANNRHINKLLSVLETPTHAQFTADRDLKQYGLDVPTVHMIMNNDQRISFGGVEPIGQRRYVRTGDTVHVIGDSPFAQLTSAASLLVDTALFADAAVIETIGLPDASLQKQEDGSWQVSTAGEYSADALNIFADEWQHARAVFVSDPAKPAVADRFVNIGLSDGSTLRFGVIKLNAGTTLVNQETGLHYHMAEDVGMQLLKLPSPTT